MGRKDRNKRKQSDNSLDGSVNNENVSKAGRYTSTPEQVCVSNLLKEANSVLFNNIESDDSDSSESSLKHIFTQQSETNRDMASAPPILPAPEVENVNNAELLMYLKKIDARIGNMEKRLDKLDDLALKVGKFENELSKLWSCVQDQYKKSNERLTAVEEKVESADFSLGLVNDKLVSLEKDNSALKEDLVYLQSQSMRNNLVFANIEEATTGGQENTEQIVRDFLESKMNIAKDLVNKMVFERVHRMGPKVHGSNRKIVAKFTLFKERELVRKQWKTLENTPYYVHEQFPKEVVAKRRHLLPKMKEAKKSGKNAWIAYDTLYIDGKAQRDDSK